MKHKHKKGMWIHWLSLFWKTRHHSHRCREKETDVIQPVARMKLLSLDTWMEVETVGISKSWISSILRCTSEAGLVNIQAQYLQAFR